MAIQMKYNIELIKYGDARRENIMNAHAFAKLKGHA